MHGKMYNITGIVSNSFPLACTPNNVTTGLKKTEIFLLNANTFSEHDFMPGYFTDGPTPEPGPCYGRFCVKCK